ncbi:MAG: SHOCT domain-containing protein [Clostridia bacterium]|nr:SHOCT domain-containing protein [Clostridia bacterium]
MSIGFLLIIILIVGTVLYGVKHKNLEEMLEFGIGIIGTIGGFIWRFTIASAKDGVMFKWAEKQGLPRWDYSVYAKSYHDYWNARANVLIAIGIVALVIGIYRLKNKKTNDSSLKDNTNNNDNVKKIEELKKLADNGTISKEDFENKKQELLKKM